MKESFLFRSRSPSGKLSVEKLERREDVWSLFSAYNKNTYTAEEKQSIDDMMQLRSLALLGYIRMMRSSFLEHCNVESKEEAMEHLIRTGWV